MQKLGHKHKQWKTEAKTKAVGFCQSLISIAFPVCALICTCFRQKLDTAQQKQVTITALRHFLQMHGMQPTASWYLPWNVLKRISQFARLPLYNIESPNHQDV